MDKNWLRDRQEALEALNDKCIEESLNDVVDPRWAIIFMMFLIRDELSDLNEVLRSHWNVDA